MQSPIYINYSYNLHEEKINLFVSRDVGGRQKSGIGGRKELSYRLLPTSMQSFDDKYFSLEAGGFQSAGQLSHQKTIRA
jgi:hypothetical protein